MDCIFCKIVKGEIPSAKVFENKDVMVFLDIAPANKGHALVTSKNHYETLLDVPDKILSNIMKTVKKVARAMSSALASEGFNILVNNNKVAGQIVPHLHLHVIPRYSNDGVRLQWRAGKYKQNEIEDYADKIKKFL
ncbi:MAG: HIT family protein [Nanoarchaeota archaeon]